MHGCRIVSLELASMARSPVGNSRPRTVAVNANDSSALQLARKRLWAVEDRCENLRRRTIALTAMRCLVLEYVPVMLCLGHDCRDCQWNPRCRERAFGSIACRVFMTSLPVLHCLQEGAPFKDEYYSGLMNALLSWQGWFDSAPGCVFF